MHCRSQLAARGVTSRVARVAFASLASCDELGCTLHQSSSPSTASQNFQAANPNVASSLALLHPPQSHIRCCNLLIRRSATLLLPLHAQPPSPAPLTPRPSSTSSSLNLPTNRRHTSRQSRHARLLALLQGLEPTTEQLQGPAAVAYAVDDDCCIPTRLGRGWAEDDCDEGRRASAAGGHLSGSR